MADSFDTDKIQNSPLSPVSNFVKHFENLAKIWLGPHFGQIWKKRPHIGWQNQILNLTD